MQSTEKPARAWHLNITLLAPENPSGSMFELHINGDVTLLGGDMVFDRVTQYVNNALRPITNDLSQHLREARQSKRRSNE